MKEFWNTIQLVFAGIGGWLGYFLGGCDGLLYALLAFVVVDYITGVMCAISNHTLSSEVGFKGICRKVLIFLLVGIANILYRHRVSTSNSSHIFLYFQRGYLPFGKCRTLGTAHSRENDGYFSTTA